MVMVDAPWLLGVAKVGQRGARHAQVVDAAVLVEAGVLDGQHRVLHHLGDLGDGREVAPLLAELAQQHAVGRKHPQRQLGPVVGQAADVGQVGVGHGQRHAHQQQQRGLSSWWAVYRNAWRQPGVAAWPMGGCWVGKCRLNRRQITTSHTV
jgi:hypothetical protein